MATNGKTLGKFAGWVSKPEKKFVKRSVKRVEKTQWKKDSK